MNCESPFFLISLNAFSLSLFSHTPKPLLLYFPDGATIESISETVVVNPGEEAKLSCNVRGKEK